MRHRAATWFTIGIGILVFLLTAVFALVQSR